MYGLRRQTTWTTLSSRLCSRFGTVRDFAAKTQKSTRFYGSMRSYFDKILQLYDSCWLASLVAANANSA